MRIMPGTKSLIGEQPVETPNLVKSRGGWVSPEPSENTEKDRYSTKTNDETRGLSFESQQQHSSRTPRKQCSMSVIQVAENIRFVNEKKDNEIDEPHGYNRGRALSNPEIPKPKGLFSTNGDGLSTRKKSLAALDENSNHLYDRRLKAPRLPNSKSSPNFLRDTVMKQSHPAVDRLVSVEEQETEMLIPGARYNIPLMQVAGKNPMRKSKSSLNLISQSRTSTPGVRDQNALHDMELMAASPFCSRGNTPRVTTSRQSTRSGILEPIPDPPLVINNCDEDRISPPLYSNGVPITIPHLNTSLLKPLEERNTPRFVSVDDWLYENETIPKRRKSLDPLSSIKRPSSQPRLDIEESVPVSIFGDQYNENQNGIVFSPAKADVLLNLHFTPTETPPPYQFSSKPQNSYSLVKDTELLNSLKTSKKRRPGTGQVIPALRAESGINKYSLLKNSHSPQNTTENIDTNSHEVITVQQGVKDTTKQNGIFAQDGSVEKSIIVQIEETDKMTNIDSNSDTKIVKPFVTLEELEKSTSLFANETIAVEGRSKTNNIEAPQEHYNNSASGTEVMANIENQQTDDFVGKFTMGVTDQLKVPEQSSGINDQPGPVKLVVSGQDSAVSITLTQPDEIPTQAVSNKKSTLSSRAIEATNRLYESPKKTMSRVATPSTPKTQLRAGRAKNKSFKTGPERDRSWSTDKQKVQKPKAKKTINMGSRPSTIAKNKRVKSGDVSTGNKAKPKPNNLNNKTQLSEREMASRRVVGREYEVRTEKNMRRIEERFNSPLLKSNQTKAQVEQMQTKNETQQTPVIQEAYPQFDKEEESLLSKVKVTVPSAQFPRRVKSAVPRKLKTQKSKKSKDDTEFNNLTKTEKKNKTVRATSAGLVVERGAKRKTKKDSGDKYTQDSPENGNITPEFDPEKHIIISTKDWHTVKEKNEYIRSSDVSETQNEVQQNATSDEFIPKLRLDTHFSLYDDKYAGPLSPIQEACYSEVSSHKSTTSKNSDINSNNNNNVAIDNDLNQEMKEESQSNDVSLTSITSKIDVSCTQEPKNETLRHDSAQNDEGIEVITLSGNEVTNSSQPHKRQNSSSKSSDSGIKTGVIDNLEQQSITISPSAENTGLIQEQKIESGDSINIKGEKLVFSFSHTDENKSSSFGDGDDVFLPEQNLEIQSNEKDSELVLSTVEQTEETCEEHSDHDNGDDEESEEDETINVVGELQKIMRSMRQRSELDAHTLINYRKSQENDNSDTDSEKSDLSFHASTAKSFDESSSSSYWKEYYKSPLEHGVLNRLFDDDFDVTKVENSHLTVSEEFKLDDLDLEETENDLLVVSEKNENLKSDEAGDRIQNVEHIMNKSDVSEENSESFLLVPFERFQSFLTNSSDNTIVNEEVSLPFQDVEEDQVLPENEISQTFGGEDFLSSCNDSDAEDVRRELEKTLQLGSDSENTGEDDEGHSFNITDSASFNGLKLTQETLQKHNEHQKEVFKQQGDCSSVYVNPYNEVERQNMISRMSAFTRTSEYSQNTDSTMKVELDTAACLGWRKGRELGSGSFGTVFEGLTRNGQIIAVKLVELTVSNRQTAEKEYKQVQEEVDLLKTLRHENVVSLLGTNLVGSTVQIFMEKVAGGSISSLLSQYGKLEEKIFRKYTKQILTGVKFLHDSSVVHRDIKGSNVMLMTCGTIKLIDFGCAKRLKANSLKRESNNNEDSRLLESVRGTSYWMAPEVIKSEKYGQKSDIWSIGCTVYEMATTKPPLHHLEQAAAIFKIGNGTDPMPQLLKSEFSKSAVDFVKKCFIRDQSLRPTASKLLNHRFITHKKKRPKSSKEK